MELPKATIVIVNTNELHHLKNCLPTVLSQRYREYEVLIVDNGSTDGSVEYVERKFHQVKVIKNSANLGYAGANNVGFQHGNGDYLVVLNPDTEVEAEWLRELVLALENDPLAGLATSKILLKDDSQRINACGNEISLTGIAVCRGLGESADTYDQPEAVSAVSGAAFAIKRSVLEHIGGFDEVFFMTYEDTDLSLRAALAGYKCIYVPTSVVYHKYAFRFSAQKCFLEERNRFLSWLKVFRWSSLIALLPAMILGEVLTWGYVLMRGPAYVRSKIKSYLWIARNWRQVAEARHRTQALRRVQDKQILSLLSHKLTLTGIVSQRVAAVLEAFIHLPLFLWARVCQVVVVW
jgi:GT2 family glycosyltransferase